MNRKVLEFRPIEGNPLPINNPLNNFVSALVLFIDSEIETRVSKQVEKRLSEINFQSNNGEPKTERKELVKAKDVAKHLKFAESTINDLAEQGKIPIAWRHKKGKKTFRRFDLDEVVAALKVNQVSPGFGSAGE